MQSALTVYAGQQRHLSQIRQIERAECGKGCCPDICRVPVALEPRFQPLISLEDIRAGSTLPHEVLETPLPASELQRLQIWLSPEYEFDWGRSELFLKLLSRVTYRLAFEIVGNRDQIYFDILHRKSDALTVTAAFSGEFNACELAPIKNDLLQSVAIDRWDDISFNDYFLPLGDRYNERLTCWNELSRSPYEPLMVALATIPPPAIGVYQVVFQPVAYSHCWHRNVRVVQNIEYVRRQLEFGPAMQRYPQQSPAGSLPAMSRQLEEKAHNDKPFFATAIRVAVIDAGTCGRELLEPISLICNLFQHGGHKLNRLTDIHYAQIMTVDKIREFFNAGITYRPGFLLNSEELAGTVHMPPPKMIESRRLSVNIMKTLSQIPALMTCGIPVGHVAHPLDKRMVYIPDSLGMHHVHLIGRPGMGKSTVFEAMFLHDIMAGHGAAVIDPHGDLIERLLCLIPADQADRVIYFNPGDPNHTPIWNPMTINADSDRSRVASNLVGAFKSFVMGWGDRLAHVFRSAVLALLHKPGSTLLDVSILLQNKSPAGQSLRSELLKLIDDPALQSFLTHALPKYRSDELAPVQHKLSLLLLGEPLSRVFCQPDSRINLRQVMDDGMILLINLSSIDASSGSAVGSLLLGLLHTHALGRSDTPAAQRRPFSVYCDEGHRFVTNALDNMIAETRKYAVSLTLAHQRISQFESATADALSSMGTTLIFNVDNSSAQWLVRDLRGDVDMADLTRLEPYEAILRCGADICRIRTIPPTSIAPDNCRDRIIEESRRRYYRPAFPKGISTPAIDDIDRTDSEVDDLSGEFSYDDGF